MKEARPRKIRLIAIGVPKTPETTTQLRKELTEDFKQYMDDIIIPSIARTLNKSTQEIDVTLISVRQNKISSGLGIPRGRCSEDPEKR